MTPLIICIALLLIFFAGWVVGTIQANARSWRESVDRSQGYQSVIDRLEKQLRDSGQEPAR